MQEEVYVHIYIYIYVHIHIYMYAIAWRSKFAKVTLFAVRALVSVAAAAGVVCQPHNNDDNFVHCTNPNDILKLLANHWSAVFAKKKATFV